MECLGCLHPQPFSPTMYTLCIHKSFSLRLNRLQLPKSPNLGDFEAGKRLRVGEIFLAQSPPEWGVWGARSDHNEARETCVYTVAPLGRGI